MLKIRMQRIGRKNMPAFRIIVAEHTRGPKTGNIVEKVGTYNPKTKEKQFNADRIKYWLSVGAKASVTVNNMLISANIISGTKIAKHQEKVVESSAPAEEAKAEYRAEETPAPDSEISSPLEKEVEEKAETVVSA
jgi:small subunit ribosomal protein S16